MLDAVFTATKLQELEKQNLELTNAIKLYVAHLKVKTETLTTLFQNNLEAAVNLNLLNDKLITLEDEKKSLLEKIAKLEAEKPLLEEVNVA